jgi:hypothetical protein
MLNINGVLKAILEDLKNKPETIKIVDDQHFIDKLSGVEFHLYDDYFQMTRGEDKPISASSFSQNEQQTIMEIKDLITDPDTTRDKKENYQKYISENRERFSNWFENPIPLTDGVQEEEDTEEYSR